MSDNESNKVQLLHHVRGQLQQDLRPVVLDYKKPAKKKKGNRDEGKEKYSSGLEGIQRLGSDVMRVTQKASKALSKGIDTYEHERQQSAKAKKDGAVEDLFDNSAKAASSYLKETSDIPVDLAEMVNKKSYRKRLRRGLRRTSRFIRMWRI